MSADFVAHCLELLAPLGHARALRMFGGHGIYVDEVFIALVIQDRLYLKADAQTQPQFEAAGCEPFRYARKQSPMTAVLSYWTAPEDALDSAPALQPWARLALAAALRARKPMAKVARQPAVKRHRAPAKKA